MTSFWSDELLEEWVRVIVREGKRKAASARSVAEAVRSFFGPGRIEPSTYRDAVDTTPGPDEANRVHTAAAIGGMASVLLTKNQRDFPREYLEHRGVRLLTADAYLRDLLRRRPSDVLASVRRLAALKRRPPRTPCELVAGLRHAGAQEFADRLTIQLGC